MREDAVETFKSIRLLIGTGAVLFVLAFAAPSAMAQGSSVETYGGQGGKAIGLTSSPSDPGSGASSSSGSLPFTGLDIGYLIGGGLLLLAAGAVMARVSHTGNRTS
jgi:hypothetical protein